MLRKLMLLGALAFSGFTPIAATAQQSVVVELFTSQGCSSCPPADELFLQLAARDDVIALALHVDYWDYIGWKDHFASPRYTQRQKGYAAVVGSRSIYTPQFIVHGEDHVVGYKPMQLAERIQAQARTYEQPGLELNAELSDGTLSVQPSMPVKGQSVLQFVTYLPEETVAIGRGENRGRTVTYGNIVTSWQVLDGWNGRDALELRVEVPQGQGAVAILQAAGQGPVLSAVRLR